MWMTSCAFGADWDIILERANCMRRLDGSNRMEFRQQWRDGSKFLDVVIIPQEQCLGCVIANVADCSIAFGIPTGAVDGNVNRVFSRLFLISADLTKKGGKTLIW
jgi:hypothetical protein